jgi:hypothetical protein
VNTRNFQSASRLITRSVLLFATSDISALDCCSIVYFFLILVPDHLGSFERNQTAAHDFIEHRQETCRCFAGTAA